MTDNKTTIDKELVSSWIFLVTIIFIFLAVLMIYKYENMKSDSELAAELKNHTLTEACSVYLNQSNTNKYYNTTIYLTKLNVSVNYYNLKRKCSSTGVHFLN